MVIFSLCVTNINAQDKHIDLPSQANVDNGFIENRGQIQNQFHRQNNELKYLLAANGMNVQLKKNSFSYDTYEVLYSPPGKSHFGITVGKRLKADSTILGFHRVDIKFPGANPSPEILTEEKLPGYTTYYTSIHPKGIVANRYKRIIYQEIYPGIDMIFEIKNGHSEKGFEYYFVVKPGGNANKIMLQYNGAVTHLENNAVTISLGNKKIKETIPGSYISTRDSVSEIPLSVSYKEYNDQTYGFHVPVYDKTKTLTIDPTPDIVWGTYYGGNLNEYLKCVAVSPDGTIVVGGVSNNDNLATAGAYQSTINGFADAMIGKFSNDGGLLWMTYFGGEKEEQDYGICTDNNGNIFATGTTDSNTGIATPGCFQPAHSGPDFSRDAYLAKFDAAGNRVWSTYFGGEDADYLNAVKADAGGNIFVAGWTYSTTGISSPGSFQPSYASNIINPQDLGDGLLARFDNDGHRIWSTYYGSTSNDAFTSLALDNNGNLYATGATASATNIATSGAFQTAFSGLPSDAFLVKFKDNGTRLWASYFGGNNLDYTNAVACDNHGNVIIAGNTYSLNNIASAGALQSTYGGDYLDGFVAKFNGNGNRLWATYYGGSGEDFINAVTCDLNNNIIIGGTSMSTDNISTGNAYQTSAPGGNLTAFFAKFNDQGNRLWGTYYGYGNLTYGEVFGIAANIKGNVLVCGSTMNSKNIATCNAVQENWAGNQDMFLGMFSENIAANILSVSIASQNDSVCEASVVTFNAMAINAGSAPIYQWKINGINVGTNSPTLTSDSLKNGDQITCTVTSSSPCITNSTATSNIISVTIIPSVIPSVSISSDVAGPVCFGTPITFTAVPVNGGSNPSYQWQINGIGTGQNQPNVTYNNLSDGDTVKCILTNSASCNTTTIAVSNNIIAKIAPQIYPSVVISASSTEVCSGTPVIFTALQSNGGSNPAYQWKLNGQTVGSGDTYTNNNLSINDTINCVLIPDINICSNSSQISSNKISVKINALPTFNILPPNPKISKGDTIQLSIRDTSNVESYKWTPFVDIDLDNIDNPKVWPASTQTYTLEAASKAGCIVRKKVTISVITGLYIPNAFTPNNDGLNDYWGIKGLELYPGCTVKVFSRFGELIYNSVDYRSPWDGTNKNQQLPEGVYVYIIDRKDRSKVLTGIVTIIR